MCPESFVGVLKEVVETLQRTIPVRPGHLWCGVGKDESVSSESDTGQEKGDQT